MVYCKALIFNKPDVAKNILKLESPAEQKYLAKSIKASKDEYKEWQKVKYEVVVEGNLAKFGVGLGVTPDEKMSERDRRLLSTGERELVEAAKNDRTRGIGFDEDTADHNREHWGQNLLGRAIMEVREQLRAEERMRQAGEENVEKMEQNG